MEDATQNHRAIVLKHRRLTRAAATRPTAPTIDPLTFPTANAAMIRMCYGEQAGEGAESL